VLKTLRENRALGVPIRLFEVGDVVRHSESNDVGAVNRRMCAAVFCGMTAGFEVIKGLLDHVMRVMGVADGEWRIDPETCEDGAFFPGRRAAVWKGETRIGSMGWVHPEVLKNFGLTYPCSALELDVEPFL